MSSALLFAWATVTVWGRMLVRTARCLLAACLLSSTLAADALAGPSVGALLAACERGLAQDNTGVDAAMCEWYAVPCDCKLTRPGSVLEPWCMPASESVDHAMRAVVGQLRREPDQELPAEQAVPAILGRLYPCPR